MVDFTAGMSDNEVRALGVALVLIVKLIIVSAIYKIELKKRGEKIPPILDLSVLNFSWFKREKKEVPLIDVSLIDFSWVGKKKDK